MKISEIKENFWIGTQQYLQYLINNDLATEEIGVSSVTSIDNKTFMLKTRNRVFDECSVEFQIRNARYNQSKIHILKNDKKRNTLLIEIKKSLESEFCDIKPGDITVISDLKFLVTRVLNWYDKFGDTIKIPEFPPNISEPKTYPGNLVPSCCQKKALKLIFSQPMSYIWGAPGTGKTSFVLANSILNYVMREENNGIILITAPTNVALEQTLLGLLPILKENNVPLNKVIRLGQPSKSFYNEYSEVCENTGVYQDITDTNSIIEALSRYKIIKEKIKVEKNLTFKKAFIENLETIKKIYSMCDFDNTDIEIEKYSQKLQELKSKTFNHKVENDLLIVACTVDAYIGRNLNATLKRGKRGISHIFLDEACYLNMAKALTLFACDCPITFLGDHKQLPPVCEMGDDEFMKEENDKAFIWAQSAIYAENAFYEDMEQMRNEYIRNIPPHFDYIQKADLNATHRFGSGLSEILEKHIYQNNFMSEIFDETEIIYLDVKSNTTEKKRENMGEVLAIKKYILENELFDYVVLTPYRNQAKLLSDNIKENVFTVHKSQGQEWDTVILSVTDTKNKYFTDTLSTESKGLQLINTAVSRAKKRLVIACDSRYWKNIDGQLISDLIEIAHPIN